MTPELRALLAARQGTGELTGPGVLRGEGCNPICGDRLWLSVEPRGDRIAALRYRVEACAAAGAVAELAARTLAGEPIAAADALASLRASVEALGGLHRAEQHAFDLFAEAFEDLQPTR